MAEVCGEGILFALRVLREKREIWIRAGLLVGSAALAVAFFSRVGHVRFEGNVVVFVWGRLSGYWVKWTTVSALAILLALLCVPSAWVRRGLRSVPGGAATLPVALFLLGEGAAVHSFYPDAFIVLTACIAISALLWGFRREIARLVDGAPAGAASLSWTPWAVVVAAGLAARALNAFVFLGHPYVIDSYARLAHAHIWNMGRWFLPCPPNWEDLVRTCMAYDGSRFYSQYLPGGILISFLGLKTGWTPWLHAFFAAGVAAMTYLSGRRICDRGTALLGSALLLISPCFLLLGASFMDHVPTAFFLMTALWLGLRDLARPGPWNAAARDPLG